MSNHNPNSNSNPNQNHNPTADAEPKLFGSIPELDDDGNRSGDGDPDADTIELESTFGKRTIITMDALKKGVARAEDTYHWIVGKLMKHFEYTPYMTRGHIQMSLGPSTPPRLWQDPLRRLVAEGHLVVNETINLYRTKRIYHLPTMPWPPLTYAEIETMKETAYSQGFQDGQKSLKE